MKKRIKKSKRGINEIENKESTEKDQQNQNFLLWKHQYNWLTSSQAKKKKREETILLSEIKEGSHYKSYRH